ncbi:hypothetical protein GIB67_034448 [Kingdonia uniflora]|uniref:MSP domain-containing protein n=1 Tax=Kingdonia uniflora TaxID=39325 RepID=A0A7J7PAY4_9MAGN|nr:hypothetical protein GIB67_034448 [Kingdonia uniflora]
MDRLVRVDVKEIELPFKRNQRCTTKFQLTNLMHTMSVAVSLTTTNPSLFSFNVALSLLPPLSSSTFTISLSKPCDIPPLCSPPDSLLVRTSMVPIGKAQQQDLRRVFSKPGPHIFRDATLPVSLVGEHVVEFLLCPPVPLLVETRETSFLLGKAIKGCSGYEVTSLLHYAVRSEDVSSLLALIEAGGDVNVRDPNGVSLMKTPVQSGDLDVVRLLIDSGFEIVDGEDLFLHAAAGINRIDLMEILCSCGSSFSAVDLCGKSPVHVAAVHGHVDALEFCLSMGGDPDCVDTNGWTPLHCAAAEGHLECVEILLHHSSYSKYMISKDGKTPYLLAIDNGHSHLSELLRLEDVLHRAARIDDVHGLKNCLAQGVKVNGRDQNGWTPLHRAAFKGQIESVKILLNNGAQIDLVDDVGYTPLHCAVEAGHAQVSLYLIAHGAIANMKSLQGLCHANLDCFKNQPALFSPMSGVNERGLIELV